MCAANLKSNFVNEAYQHCKTIAASGAGVELLESAGVIRQPTGASKSANGSSAQAGVLTTRGDDVARIAAAFVKGIGQHRHWERERAV
jgi:catalase